MNDDIKIIKNQILEFLPLIQKEYNISEEKINDIIKNIDRKIMFDDKGISFHVKHEVLYLPVMAYKMIEEFKKNEQYGTTKNTGVQIQNYLNTDSTYKDYITHMITYGYSVLDYFKDSLLHETLHMCGGGNDSSLEEGINELKTRQLAQKYNIKIAAVGYNQEVEIAQMLESILGKKTMDVIAFIKDKNQIYEYMVKHHTNEEIELYYNVKNTMEEEGKIYQTQTTKTNNPFEKAEVHDKLEYIKTKEIINSYMSTHQKQNEQEKDAIIEWEQVPEHTEDYVNQQDSNGIANPYIETIPQTQFNGQVIGQNGKVSNLNNLSPTMGSGSHR